MASVDGSKSYMEGSDEVPLHICGPCKDDGETITADHYCEHCKDYLCNACKDYHRKFKATKTHNILSGNLVPKLKSPADKFTCNVICSCNQNKEVEIYCEDHMEVLCMSCEMMKHRKCKTSSLQDKGLGYRKENFGLTLEKANSLENKIESIQTERREDLQKLETLSENCLTEIKEFRSQINDLLDRAEEAVLVDLKNAEEQRNCLAKDISTLTTTLQALNTETKLLENANKDGKEEVMFAADVKASKNIQEYGALIEEIEKEMQTPDLMFEMNKTVADLLKEIKSLCTIRGSKLRQSQQNKKAIIDLQVMARNEINIRLPDDSQTPSITSCAFIGDCILLCDNTNNRIKLLDNKWKVNESLNLKCSPWNISAIDEHRAVITLPITKHLQFMQVFPQLKAENVIELDDAVAGLEVVGDEIYTVVHKKIGEDEIWTLDLSGKIKRKINIDQKMAGMPFYLSLTHVGKNTRMYISDWEGSTVTCLRSDGTVVYQFKDPELCRANGIYVDSEGNAFVCGSNSNNVIVLTPSGKKHKSLLSSSDGIRAPISIAFRPEDDTLIVGCQRHTEELYVFTLGK